MPITLRHISVDTTWLITFTSPQGLHPDFRILTDPWLDGPSLVLHPKFVKTTHVIPSSIANLRDLQPQPDIVLISQDKSDHCHEPTLRQLPQQRIKILAVPGA